MNDDFMLISTYQTWVEDRKTSCVVNNDPQSPYFLSPCSSSAYIPASVVGSAKEAHWPTNQREAFCSRTLPFAVRMRQSENEWNSTHWISLHLPRQQTLSQDVSVCDVSWDVHPSPRLCVEALVLLKRGETRCHMTSSSHDWSPNLYIYIYFIMSSLIDLNLKMCPPYSSLHNFSLAWFETSHGMFSHHVLCMLSPL